MVGALALLAMYGCGGPGNVGNPCDPLAVTPPCGPGLTCSVDCGPDLTCSSIGVCGVPCGSGNTVCDPDTLCTTEASNCVPPCIVNGSSVVVSGSCDAIGLLTLEDGTCMVPCFYFACTALGGHCPVPIPRSMSGPLRAMVPIPHRIQSRSGPGTL